MLNVLAIVLIKWLVTDVIRCALSISNCRALTSVSQHFTKTIPRYSKKCGQKFKKIDPLGFFFQHGPKRSCILRHSFRVSLFTTKLGISIKTRGFLDCK